MRRTGVVGHPLGPTRQRSNPSTSLKEPANWLVQDASCVDVLTPPMRSGVASVLDHRPV